MKRARECRCKAEHVVLYGIVSYNYVNQQFNLHTVDRTRKRAEEHLIMVKEEFRIKDIRAQVRMEELESDHAFASSMRIA